MDVHPNFKAMFPRSVLIGLKPVRIGDVQHAGFDIEEVEKALGAKHFADLMAGQNYHSGVGPRPGPIQVFSCGHRNWAHDHADPSKRGCEVHCIYARDLEDFLSAKA